MRIGKMLLSKRVIIVLDDTVRFPVCRVSLSVSSIDLAAAGVKRRISHPLGLPLRSAIDLARCGGVARVRGLDRDQVKVQYLTKINPKTPACDCLRGSWDYL